jgi:SAM-dependent methyltransferase
MTQILDRVAVVCQLCLSEQSISDADAWECRNCGQKYRGEESILLNERQLAALRTLSGRDATGKSTLVANWWTQNDQPAGETFLDFNKDEPSRQFTRKLIVDAAAARSIKTVLEIAFGGLHEYRAMRSALMQHGITYSGVDWTAHFVEHARREFPENTWLQGDVVRGITVEPADVVYTQHMFEHLPALEPAFSNLLRLARQRLINIFFIPPKPLDGYEVTNWKQYPLYHNTYSVGHIEAICRAMGFKPSWTRFPVHKHQVNGAPVEDMVLVADRI